MVRRIFGALPCAAVLFLACGCVEINKVITLNPDGRGKMTYDMVAAAGGISPTIGKQTEETLEQMKQKAILKMLTGKGFTAWKDVSAEWLPDGRLHFKGTAYFEKLDDFSGKDQTESYHLTRPSVGVLKIVLKTNKDAKKKSLPDLATMTDKDLDAFILKERVSYQSAKPVLLAMLTDLKLTTAFQLPGEIGELKGFKKQGDHGVSWAIDGNAVLKHVTGFMAQDNVALRKKIKDANSLDFAESFGLHGLVRDAEVTVSKLTGPQFDYDKEVQQAREAYLALRTQLQLDPKTKLPGE